MLQINYTDFENDMKKYMDEATKNNETILIKCENGNNVVMVSEKAYNICIKQIEK